MHDLTKFLSRIQTFNLKIVPSLEVKDLLSNNMENAKDAYWIGEESGHLEYSNIQSELRLLKDMALMNILFANIGSLEPILLEMKKVRARFQSLWNNYHLHFDEEARVYPSDYIIVIDLPEIFLVNNLNADRDDIIIGADFVESLSDSVKLRERMLNELMFEVEQMLYPAQLLQLDRGASAAVVNTAVSDHVVPQFSLGIAKVFLEVLKPYFPEGHYPMLEAFIQRGGAPTTPLVFKGNGNQLADAFKQLYEANLIVGCNKMELEKWIAKHFVYRHNNVDKEFTEGYLNGIISTDVKPCKSPILEIKKKEDKYVIVSSLRNKKNNRF
jgi:hypothetical protein